MTIDEILHRRSDLSTFVVHFTRDAAEGESAGEVLQAILRDEILQARSPLGWAAREAEARGGDVRESQCAVCFTEAPLEHLHAMCGEIEGRQVRLQPYGLALSKTSARRLGVNPVWYVDMTPGRTWIPAQALNDLRDAALAGDNFVEHPASKVFPFFEAMGTWNNRRREFWWEREWRHTGDLNLATAWGSDVAFGLCPEDEIDFFEEYLPTVWREDGADEGWIERSRIPFLDPRWGLERMISHLVGI